MSKIVEKPDWAAVGNKVAVYSSGYGRDAGRYRTAVVLKHTATQITIGYDDNAQQRAFYKGKYGNRWQAMGTADSYRSVYLVSQEEYAEHRANLGAQLDAYASEVRDMDTYAIATDPEKIREMAGRLNELASLIGRTKARMAGESL